MERHAKIEENKVILTLSGYIYAEDAEILRNEFIDYTDKGYSTFIVDMNNVVYIDSAGLQALVAVNRRAAKAGGSVILSGLKGTVQELFQLTRLDKLFKVENNINL